MIIYLGFDLLYSIYYVLTCKHEIDKNQWDRYNRVNEKNNLLLRNKKQNIPWVNLYLRFLEDLIKYCFVERKIPLIKKWYWPDNAKFAAWLSHDVDEVKKFTIKKSAMNLMHKKVGDSVAGLGKSFKGADKDPYWSFARIMDLEKQHGFVSTFFFGALTSSIRKIRSGKEKVRGLEIAYNIDNKDIQTLIKNINKKGWEVGLHGSYGSFKNYKRLKAEKQVLDKATGVKCKGVRQHYLRWEHPETWQDQEKGGLQYDSTLGYSNSIGFKPGYAFPYRIFSDSDNKPLKMVELPLIAPDSGMGPGSKNQIEKKVKGLITEVKKNNGLLTLLFHNDRFSSTEVTSSEEFYSKILKHLKSKNVYNDTGTAIVDWWQARDMVVWKGGEYGTKKCTWTVKPSRTIEKITFKIQAPLKLLNKCKLKIGPRCKVISQETEKGINVGTISLTIDKLAKDQVYKITIAK
jgi:peptidoglycan/xylan/chitin deacetylase (PgdA/CDA1 family)